MGTLSQITTVLTNCKRHSFTGHLSRAAMPSVHLWGGIFLLGFSLLLLGLSGCSSSRNIQNRQVPYLYHITDQAPLPFYTLYQYRPDSLHIWFDIPVRSGSRSRDDRQEKQGYMLEMMLLSDTGRQLIDSATYHFLPDTLSALGMVSGRIDIFTSEPSGRHLSLRLTDLEHSASHLWEERLPPAWPPSTTHFLATDTAGVVINPQFMEAGATFTLESTLLDDQEVRVRYHADHHTAAWPPFVSPATSQIPFAADSLFTIRFTAGKSAQLQFDRPGIYHLQTDSASRRGFTLFVRDYPHPWIEFADQMIPPLRYITTAKEFEALSSATDSRKAAEEFWVGVAGNELRATRLIQDYYRRVEKANYLFSSYIDGWKTDRGMIYIMYGAPSVVEQTSRTEIWTYGESRHMLSLSFVFVKMQNPFTDHDYMLERSPTYKTGWHQRVNSWRR